MRRHLALAAAVVLGPMSAFGQTKEEASRLFFKGDILARQAEQYAGAGRDAQARQAYENALAQFQALSRDHPDYSPAAVERRVKDTRARLQALGSSENPSAPKAARLTGQGSSSEKPVAQQLASPTSGATSPRGGGPMLASTGRSSAGTGGGAAEQDPMALLRAATPMATKAAPSPDADSSPRETGPSFQGTAPERPASTVKATPAPRARGTAVGAESVAVEGQLQKSLQEIDALTRQLNQAESRLTAESGRNTDLENQMKSLREQIAAAQKAVEDGKDTARKLESMEDKLKQMEMVARKQVEAKDSEIAAQKESMERLTRELAAAKQREEMSLEENPRELMDKVAEERVGLMQRNDELTEQLRTTNGELAKYRDAAKSDLPTVRLQELQARIEAQTKEQKTTLEKLKALQTELKSAHDDAQTLREQLAAADTGQHPAANSEELTEYKRRSEQAAKDKLESLQEIARLRGEVAKASEALTAAQKERDAAIAAGASDADLAADLASVRKTLAEAQEQRDHLAQRVVEFQAKEKQQEESAAELQVLLAEARQREDAAQVELKKSLAAAQAAEAPLKTRLSELEKSQMETLDALNAERQQVAKLETELDLLKKENGNLKITVDRQKGTPESDMRIAELTETLETVRRESAKLQEERQALQASKVQADQEAAEKLAAKDAELAKTSKALAALQSENKTLQNGQGTELAALTKQKSEIEKELASTKSEAEQKDGLLKEVQAKLAAAEKERTSLEAEVAALKKSGTATLAKTEDKAPQEDPPGTEEPAKADDSSDDLLAEAMKLADSAADNQSARQEQLARQAAAEVEKLRKSTASVEETPKNKPLPGPEEQPAEPAANKGVEAPKESENSSASSLVSLDTNAYELPLPGELPTAQALSASRNMGAIARGETFDASLEAVAAPTAAPLVGSRSANPAGLPDDMADLAREAKRYFEGRQYPQAEKAFEKIVEKEPENVFAMSNLGVVRFRMKKYKEAEEILQRAVKVDAEDAFSWETLGIVYYSQNRIDEAIEVLSRSISIDSQSATAHNFLGIASSKKGWPEAAEDELRKAITLNPNYADAHFNLAVLYATSATPSNALARQHYQRATSLGAAPNPSLESMIKGN